MSYPLITRAEAPTPPTGFQYLFRDKDNAAMLTSKEDDGQFIVIVTLDVNSEQVDEVTKLACKIIDDAGCALQKGLITALEYQSIIDNLNICITVDVDPVTGSNQTCVANTPTIFVALVLTHALCNGDSNGTATPTITGGTAPYVLDWDGDDPAALAAGMHTLTVTDANAKVKMVGFIITEPAVLAGAISSTDETSPAAGDGTATVLITGGTEPYTYLWDDPGAQVTATATGLDPGDYNCIITDDNGCVLNLGPVTVS